MAYARWNSANLTIWPMVCCTLCSSDPKIVFLACFWHCTNITNLHWVCFFQQSVLRLECSWFWKITCIICRLLKLRRVWRFKTASTCLRGTYLLHADHHPSVYMPLRMTLREMPHSNIPCACILTHMHTCKILTNGRLSLWSWYRYTALLYFYWGKKYSSEYTIAYSILKTDFWMTIGWMVSDCRALRWIWGTVVWDIYPFKLSDKSVKSDVLVLTIRSNTSIIFPDALLSSAFLTLHNVMKQQQMKSACEQFALITESQSNNKDEMDASDRETYAQISYSEVILPDKYVRGPHSFEQPSVFTGNIMSTLSYRLLQGWDINFQLWGSTWACSTAGSSRATQPEHKHQFHYEIDYRQLKSSTSGIYTSTDLLQVGSAKL